MAKNKNDQPANFTIRRAVRYLEDTHGIEVSELSLRSKLKTLDVFTADAENTFKGPSEGSDREEWHVGRVALDNFAQAVKSGGVRQTNSDGAKAYKLSVNADQLAELRVWATGRGIAEPVRANKQYTSKKGVNVAGGDTESLAEMADGEEPVGSDTIFA